MLPNAVLSGLSLSGWSTFIKCIMLMKSFMHTASFLDLNESVEKTRGLGPSALAHAFQRMM